MDILKDKTVKIRKPHKCLMCGRTFPAGTQMNYQVNTYDGFCAVYTCKTCDELRVHIEVDPIEMCFTQDCVTEELDAFNFKGTPEEYLAIKRAERIAKNSTYGNNTQPSTVESLSRG